MPGAHRERLLPGRLLPTQRALYQLTSPQVISNIWVGAFALTSVIFAILGEQLKRLPQSRTGMRCHERFWCRMIAVVVAVRVSVSANLAVQVPLDEAHEGTRGMASAGSQAAEVLGPSAL